MDADKATNHLIIGQPNTGKSSVLLNAVLDDLEADRGLIFIDPHGDSVTHILERYPRHRDKDLIIFDITDADHPIGFNPLECDHESDIPTTVLFLLESLKSAAKYDGAATVNFDQSINASGFMAIADADNTLLAMLMILTDKGHREKVLGRVKDSLLKKYWQDFQTLSAKRQEEIIGSAISQLNMLLLDTRLRNVLSQKKSAFRFKDILSDNTVLLIKLPITKLGKEKVATLGSLILSQVFSAIGDRDTTERFSIYIKDIQYFASQAFVNLMGIAPRYNVSLTFCHHYLAQLPRDIQEAFIGNTGYKTIFRLGMTDAEVFEKTMVWDNSRDKLFELPDYTARLVRGQTITQEPMPALKGEPDVDRVKELVRMSRQTHAIQRSQIEPKLDDFIGGQDD